MKRMQSLLFVLVFLSLSAYSHAQNWSGIIAPSRAVDWSSAGIPGGIPNRTTICATLNPGATVAQINSAIASCPANQVVFLNAGTYNLSSGIDFNNRSNVTVRGAGADQTFLTFSGSISCMGLRASVCIRNGDNSSGESPSNTANWTAGYAKGTTQITLSNTANLHAGTSLIVLDQTNDSNTDTGSIWVCGTGGVCASEGNAGGFRSGRAQGQIVLVTAINGNTVTISPGLYMPNWSSGRSPQAWWASTIVTGDGVENLSMNHTSSGGQAGIVIFNTYRCWVKGVRSLNSNRSHVWIFQSAHNVIRDSYFYGTQNSASQSYGIEEYPGGDNLIENNIFQRIVAPQIVNGSSSGTVFGYNYNIDNHNSNYPSAMFAAAWLHSPGIAYDLWEGNVGNGFASDAIHGTHHFITLFRNQYLGWESGKSSQQQPIAALAFSRYFNFVGNVLGRPGFTTPYQCITSCNTFESRAAFLLGASPGDGVANDPLVATTSMRWGNFDTVNNASRYVASEVPSGISLYANPVPATNTLPASFYYSSKPFWWGTLPWPAIGPEITGGTDATGHAYGNPAQLCYNTSAKDGSGILTFSADRCYSQNRPLPPTNVTVIVN